MAVIITDAPPTPTGMSAIVSAGGSLDANTTYYYRIVGSANTNNSYSPTNRNSSPSVEDSFTTTTTDKQATITWDDMANTSGYYVYVSKTSGVYNGNSRFTTSSGYDTASESYVVSSNPTSAGRHLFCTAQTLPCGIDKEASKPSINFTGTTSFQDIYDAMVAGGYSSGVYYDGGIFAIVGNIYVSGADATTLTEKNKVVIFVHGTIVNTNPNATLTFGTYDSSVHAGYDGCVFYHFQYSMRAFSGNTQPLDLSGCIFKSIGLGLVRENYNLCGDAYTYNQENQTFSGTKIENTFSDIDGETDVVVSSIANAYLIGGGSITTITRPKLYYAYFFDYVQNNNQEITIDSGEIWGTRTSDIRSGRSGDDLTKFLNCTFPYHSDNIPVVRWDQASYRGAKQFWFTLDLTVVDSTDSPVVGASVAIIDVNGDAVTGSPFTTDSDGNISTGLYGYRMAYGGSDLVSIKTDKTPHTVTISKSGYQTRVIKYNMTEKRTEVEKLTADGTNISGGTFYGATIY